MIIKGRSSPMRHVSRTHRFALDWLFDRIDLEPKIQIKYVDTKSQLADMLTWGSFTRDEWNHLLRFFNIMNFSMFFCSHFSNFLSDPIGNQSAMSKRGQESTSRRNQSQWFWRRRDPSIWCCTTRWVRGRILRMIWETQSIRRMSMKNEAVILAPGNQCGLTKARSNRIFSSKATGKHANSRKQGGQGWIFELD